MCIFVAKNVNLKTVSTKQNEEFTDRKKAELTKAFQANDQDTFLMIFQILPPKNNFGSKLIFFPNKNV